MDSGLSYYHTFPIRGRGGYLPVASLHGYEFIVFDRIEETRWISILYASDEVSFSLLACCFCSEHI